MQSQSCLQPFQHCDPPPLCAFLIYSSEHVVELWNQYWSQCHRNKEHTVPLL